MLRWLKGLGLLLASAIAVIIGLTVLYGAVSILLSILPVNRNQPDPAGPSVNICFISNGVHFDILLPARNEYKDWLGEIFDGLMTSSDSAFIGFGWGDKGFYLTTPTWADLTFPTAFRALFLKSESAMHVSFYPNLYGYNGIKKIRINPEQYLELVKFIDSSFRKSPTGETILIQCEAFGDPDCYYEARRSYSLFYTCNTWANQALKRSGLRACVWTPFDKGLIFQYRHEK